MPSQNNNTNSNIKYSYEEGSAYCCGLAEIGEFAYDMWEDADFLGNFKPEKATFATTIPGQKNTIQILKELGFKPVATFLGSQRPCKEITLWLIIPPDKQIKNTDPSPVPLDTAA